MISDARRVYSNFQNRCSYRGCVETKSGHFNNVARRKTRSTSILSGNFIYSQYSLSAFTDNIHSSCSLLTFTIDIHCRYSSLHRHRGGLNLFITPKSFIDSGGREWAPSQPRNPSSTYHAQTYSTWSRNQRVGIWILAEDSKSIFTVNIH